MLLLAPGGGTLARALIGTWAKSPPWSSAGAVDLQLENLLFAAPDSAEDCVGVLGELLRRRTNLTRESGSGPAYGYDMGRLVAEGLSRAPERTRDGIKDGLEQVKWLPAAEGYEGTTLGFGHLDRGALHGRYLVLRQWQNGSSVEL